jgi:hypothetical protein
VVDSLVRGHQAKAASTSLWFWICGDAVANFDVGCDLCPFGPFVAGDHNPNLFVAGIATVAASPMSPVQVKIPEHLSVSVVFTAPLAF